MKPYSEDLRKKFVAAVERGMIKFESARLLDVSSSSVERYARIVSHRGDGDRTLGGQRRRCMGFFNHCGYRPQVQFL
jgi:transposase